MSEKKGIFTKAELKTLLSKKHSCVVLRNSVIDVYLLPYYLNDVVAGLWSALYKKLKVYDSKLEGILLGYQNIKVDLDAGRFCGRNAEIKYPVNCDCFIFQPSVGDMLQGTVNQMSSDHIGCIVHQFFNATIKRPLNEDSDDWNNRCIDYDEVITFRVKDLDYTGFIPIIEGELEEYPVKKKKSSDRVYMPADDRNEEVERRPGKTNKSLISSTQIQTRDSRNFSESALEFDLLSPIPVLKAKKNSSAKEKEDSPGRGKINGEQDGQKASNSKSLKRQLETSPVTESAKKRRLNHDHDGSSSSHEPDGERKKKKKKRSLFEMLVPPQSETILPAINSSNKINSSVDNNVVSIPKKKKIVNFDSGIDEPNKLCTNSISDNRPKKKKSNVSEKLISEEYNITLDPPLVDSSNKRSNLENKIKSPYNPNQIEKETSLPSQTIESVIKQGCSVSETTFLTKKKKSNVPEKLISEVEYNVPSELPVVDSPNKSLSLQKKVKSPESEAIEEVVNYESCYGDKNIVKQSKTDKITTLGEETNIISLSPVSEAIENVVKLHMSSDEKITPVKVKSKSKKRKTVEEETKSSSLIPPSEMIDNVKGQQNDKTRTLVWKQSKIDKNNKLVKETSLSKNVMNTLLTSHYAETIDSVVKQENSSDETDENSKVKQSKKNKLGEDISLISLSHISEAIQNVVKQNTSDSEKNTTVTKKSKSDKKHKPSSLLLSEVAEGVVKMCASAVESSKKIKMEKKNKLETEMKTFSLSPCSEMIENVVKQGPDSPLSSASSVPAKKKKQSPKKNVQPTGLHFKDEEDQKNKTDSHLKKIPEGKAKKEPLKVTKKSKEKQDPDARRISQYLKKMKEIAEKGGKQDLLQSMLNEFNI